MPKDQRNRLVLARTLRRFGLSDKFGLSDLVERAALPSQAKIARAITDSTYLLPPGISAGFLAEHIISDLKHCDCGDSYDHAELRKLVRALTKIRTGNAAATQFQMAMLAIFRPLFQERLGEMKPEVTIFSGIKRVDIVADNDQSTGFFNGLGILHNLLCPSILFECKNYGKDPGNPEFDQLLARLNPTSTQVGFIVCRPLKDATRARDRCKEAYLREQRTKLMLWLTDTDVIELSEARIKGGATAVDAWLKGRFEDVTLK